MRMQRLPSRFVAPLWAATILFAFPFNSARSQEPLAVRCLGFTNRPAGVPGLLLELTGSGSTRCRVESSSNLVDWTPSARFSAFYAHPSRFPTNNLVLDPTADAAPARFYRAVIPVGVEPDPYAAWTNAAPRRYRYHYQGTVNILSTAPLVAADVHLEDGAVRLIENVTGGAGLTPQMMTNSVRTIEGLFNTLRQATQFKARTIVVAYDPVWSFPQWIAVDDTTEFATEPAPTIWHRVTGFVEE